MTRLRLVALVIQPQLVEDDGETLTPLQTQPITVNAADIDTIADRLRADLAAAETQRNAPPDESG